MTHERRVRSIRRFRRSSGWPGAAAGFFLVSSPVAAQTCPCPTFFDLAAIVREADVIFVGKSLSATTDSTIPGQNNEGQWWGGVDFQTRLFFDVQTVIKGGPPRFVEAITPTGPCGFLFAVGETYLVAAKGQGVRVITDACMGNVRGLDAIDARAEAIRKVLDPDPTPRETPERH